MQEMDANEAQQLREEVAALRTRVARLESLLPNPRSQEAVHRASAVEPLPDATFPPALSFTAPAKPSLESRIGSQVFNRVGIVALLIGVAWCLKYAFDRQWLGPAARVGVGLLTGLAVMAWSERFRRRGYPVFSYSLKAVGTGMLYLSLWAAFSVFHLLGYPVAFAGMMLVTAGNGGLCWAQRSDVLALYVAIGGFLTPALLGGEQASVLALGAYLLLLNAGLFTLTVLRRWPRLPGAAFVGTAGYLLPFALHAGSLRVTHQVPTAQSLALLFFALFSAAPVLIAAWRHPAGPVGAGESPVLSFAHPREFAVLVMANAALAFFELWRLQSPGNSLTDWLPVGFALWFGAILVFQRRRPVTPLASVHAALVAAFAAVGCWTVLPGASTVAGWGAEAATLLFLSLRPGCPAFVRSPLPNALLLGAGAFLLFADSLSSSLSRPEHVLINERFGLYLLLIGVAVFAIRIAARQYASAQHSPAPSTSDWTAMAAGSALLASTLVLAAGCLEIHTFWAGTGGTAEQFSYSAWATVLGVALLALGFRIRWAFLRWQALALLTLAVGKVFAVDTRTLSQGFRILSFLGLGALLLLVSFIYQRDLLNLRGREHGG